MKMPKLLFCDTAANLNKPLIECLERNGIRVHVCERIEETDALIEESDFDVIILSVKGYDKEALDFVRGLWSKLNRPLIILTDHKDDFENIVYLELGADGYLSLPLDPRVLVAHVRAVVRRSQASRPLTVREPSATAAVATFRGWRFNRKLGVLTSPDGIRISLTASQSVLLDALVRKPRTILLRSELISQLGGDPAVTKDHVIDSHMARLRRIFEPDIKGTKLIRCEKISGYAFGESVRWLDD